MADRNEGDGNGGGREAGREEKPSLFDLPLNPEPDPASRRRPKRRQGGEGPEAPEAAAPADRHGPHRDDPHREDAEPDDVDLADPDRETRDRGDTPVASPDRGHGTRDAPAGEGPRQREGGGQGAGDGPSGESPSRRETSPPARPPRERQGGRRGRGELPLFPGDGDEAAGPPSPEPRRTRRGGSAGDGGSEDRDRGLADAPLPPGAPPGGSRAGGSRAGEDREGKGRDDRPHDLPEDRLDLPAEGPPEPPAAAPSPRRPRPAPLPHRVGAALLDGGLLLVASAAAIVGSFLMGVRWGVEDLPALGLFLLVFSFAYSVVPLAFWGRTPGMALAGIVSRGADGGPLTFGQTAVRWLAALLTLALAGLPLLLALGPLGGRSLADRLSGSRTWLPPG